MTVAAGYLGTPESRTALDHAVHECHAHAEDLLVVTTSDARVDSRSGAPLDVWIEEAQSGGLRVEMVVVEDDHHAASELIDVSYDRGTSMVVVGVRRRSPVGKAVAGSFSQRVVLDAYCPVVTVKPPARAS